MRKYLKIKIKSLASEARHIRLEERHTLKNARYCKDRSQEDSFEYKDDFKEHSEEFYNLYQNLRDHRVNEVRKEARASLLAYGFLNGLEYTDMEESIHSKPDWPRVERCVYKFSDDLSADLRQRFEEWLQIAKGVADEPRKVNISIN